MAAVLKELLVAVCLGDHFNAVVDGDHPKLIQERLQILQDLAVFEVELQELLERAEQGDEGIALSVAVGNMRHLLMELLYRGLDFEEARTLDLKALLHGFPHLIDGLDGIAYFIHFLLS